MAARSEQQDEESTPLLRDPASHNHQGEAEWLSLQGQLSKVATNASWGNAVGLRIREPNDENLLIFRRALGINKPPEISPDHRTLEEGRKEATGIYAAVIRHQRRKRVQYIALLTGIYTCHFAQIVLGAILTILGPKAQEHKTAITLLGAANTLVAGFLALITRLSATEKLHKDEVQFRMLQTWIEETDTLLVLGIIGKDRTEVGKLVQAAYKKYNSTEAREETNQPDALVPKPHLATSREATGA